MMSDGLMFLFLFISLFLVCFFINTVFYGLMIVLNKERYNIRKSVKESLIVSSVLSILFLIIGF